jgi:2',3'-cyclic-nucleotide 2'-phosphodiesterase (5'-nucleotidase family)
LAGVERTRVTIDSQYDTNPDEAAAKFLAPFKRVNDSIMGPVMGTVAHNMHAQRPESDLSNLLADILVWASKDYGEQPVFGVYNMGGIRAALSKGAVTYGDVLDVAPFENKICFLTLTGDKLMELFAQIARRGGEGVSRGVQMRISNGKLLSATLNGKPINPNESYRIATLDYLAQGNDGLLAFKDGTNVLSPKTEENNVRFVIMNYIRAEAAEGRAVSAEVEGRIISESNTSDIPLGN